MHKKSAIRYWKISGFSMIELTIAFLMLSIGTLSIIQVSNAKNKQYKHLLTIKRQRMIMQAIGRYASQFGCLPYPCLPDQLDIGLQQSLPTTENWLTQNKSIGIIPWKTLGLPKSYIFDGYGNAMKYIAHPLLCGRQNIQQSPNHKTLLESYAFTKRASAFCFSNFQNNIDSISKHEYQNLIQLKFTENIIYNHKDCYQIGKITDVEQTPQIVAINPVTQEEKIYNHAGDNLNLIHLDTDHAGRKIMTSTQSLIEDLAKQKYIVKHKYPGKIDYTQKVCDCVAFVIIGYNTALLTEQNPDLIINDNHNYIIRISSINQIVSYATRFNLQTYSGPRCFPFAFGQTHLEQRNKHMILFHDQK